MENTELEKLRYPIGKFEAPTVYTSELLAKAIKTIEQFPQKLKSEVAHLSQIQLETPYRPEGWTIRQVVHHCADVGARSLSYRRFMTTFQPASQACSYQIQRRLVLGFTLLQHGQVANPVTEAFDRARRRPFQCDHVGPDFERFMESR